jgi:hypothetical protein
MLITEAELLEEIQTLRVEVVALRRQVAACEADNTRLRAALRAARRPHQFTCLAPLLPCNCDWVKVHNAAIDAALGDAPDESSAATESPTPEADH